MSGRARALLPLAGFAIAAVSAMCGIGGGLFAVPILHYLFHLSLARSVATALCLVWCVALSSTVSELLHPGGAILWTVVGVLVITSLAGTQVGYRAARTIPTRGLKALFCVALLSVGIRVLVGSGGAASAPLEGFELEPASLLAVAAIGFFAGVVVPLLGVGGGLVVVPALLLCLPEAGFLGARAAALATAVVSASRSLWLYQRDGLIDWKAGGFFGVGAVVGAAVGVALVHLPGAATVGQAILGVALLMAAVRFGMDVRRGGTKDADEEQDA